MKDILFLLTASKLLTFGQLSKLIGSHLIATLTAMLLTCCSSNIEVKAQETQPSSNGKVMVAYFSFTNNTKAYAEKIAEITGGDLYEIIPEMAYGSENSNYYDQSTRAYKEQYNTGGEQRPAIKATLENATQYDVVFLGSPIWYGKSPRVILTFLDKYGFQGKTVIPFVTSASSGISNVNSELPSTYPDINWKEGRRLNGVSDSDLRIWVQGFVGTAAINNVRSPKHVSSKVYTLSGAMAQAGAKGIVILNGTKRIIK